MYQYLLYITAPTGQICTNIVKFKSQADFEAAKDALQQSDVDFQWEFIPLFDVEEVSNYVQDFCDNNA